MSRDNHSKNGERPLLDGGFWVLVVLAVCSMVVATAIHGTGALVEGGGIIAHDLEIILPQITLGVMVGTLFAIVLPKALVARHLGEGSGLGGLALAEAIGAIMPGGPFAAFPLVVTLGQSGAAPGPLMAFLVGWETLGLSRMLVWELPFMGSSFALLRFLSCLPLPILAGLLASWLARRFPGVRPDFST